MSVRTVTFINRESSLHIGKLPSVLSSSRCIQPPSCACRLALLDLSVLPSIARRDFHLKMHTATKLAYVKLPWISAVAVARLNNGHLRQYAEHRPCGIELQCDILPPARTSSGGLRRVCSVMISDTEHGGDTQSLHTHRLTHRHTYRRPSTIPVPANPPVLNYCRRTTAHRSSQLHV